MSTRTAVIIAITNGILAIALLVTITTEPARIERAIASVSLYSTSSAPVFVSNPRTDPVLNAQLAQSMLPYYYTNIDPCRLDNFMVGGGYRLIASGPPITMIGRNASVILPAQTPSLPSPHWTVSCSTGTSSVLGLQWAVLAKPLYPITSVSAF